MTAMIKPGSKVKCVDDSGGGVSSVIKNGNLYEVDSINGAGYYTLVGINFTPLSPTRFREVPGNSLIGRKVRCLKNEEVERALQIGSIYEIDNVADNGNYHLKGIRDTGDGEWFMSSRFEFVSDDSTPVSVASTDLEEDTIWKRWTTPAPGNCKCGMLKAQCHYHGGRT